jgi:MAF protein
VSAPAPDRPLILASASPRRRELLAALGVPFAIRPTDVDETPPAGAPPDVSATAITLRKLKRALAARKSAADVVLAADTIVVLDGAMLAKPADAAEARAMLGALAGREHEVITAVAVDGTERRVKAVRTAVRMRPYSAAEIEDSIAAGTPFDKAGGYAIQDPLLHPVERCAGCYCSVMGLPLWTAHDLIATALPGAGLTPPDRTFARCAVCPLHPLGT